MPVLKNQRETKTMKLQTVEGGEATVIAALLGVDVEKLVKLRKDENASPLTPLTVIITGWNLTGEDGAVLPVTVENCGLLKMTDVEAIMDGVEGMDGFLGKKTGAATAG